MKEWKKVKLGDILELQRGYDLSRKQMDNMGPYPVAGSNGIIGMHSKYTMDLGVTIGRSGNIGNAFFYRDKFWAHNTVLFVKDFKGNSSKFIYYLFKSIDFSSFNTGSAVPSLNRNHVHQLGVLIPIQLNEQKAIAEVLSNLDDKIELLQKQNETLEQLAETLFRQWFIEEAEEDWEEKELSFFGKVVCGKTPPKKKKEYYGGDFPFVKIPDMHGNIFITKTTDTLSEEGKNFQLNKTIPPKSIMVSCIATVGVVSMNLVDVQTNQQINSIIPKSKYYTYYLYVYLKSKKEYLNILGGGGTATLNINTGTFSKLEIIYPSDEVIKKYDRLVSPYFDKIESNQLQIQTLTEMRDTLLPKLMSGAVRVKLTD